MIIRHKFCYILVWSKLVSLYFQLPDGQYSDQQKETGQNNTHLSLKLDIQKGHSLKTKLNFFLGSLGDVTQDDSQRRFSAQHWVAMVEQCCNHLKQCRNNVATLCCAKNRRCESCRVTSPLSSNDGLTSKSRHLKSEFPLDSNLIGLISPSRVIGQIILAGFEF